VEKGRKDAASPVLASDSSILQRNVSAAFPLEPICLEKSIGPWSDSRRDLGKLGRRDGTGSQVLSLRCSLHLTIDIFWGSAANCRSRERKRS
jgi:hypothetical protein